MNKALFLDLDGTIIVTQSGETFPRDINDWKFNQDVLKKIKNYYQNGYNIIIVTNQGGISEGYVKKEDFEKKLNTIIGKIERFIDGSINYAYCPDMISYYRKPNPGMAYQMALYLELSLRDSIMVGDMTTDNEFAKNAYIGTYYDINSFLNA